MKVIIAGSRCFNDYETVSKLLDQVEVSANLHITEVVCGMARGVDLFGKRWAESRNIPVKEFPADWKNLGKKAGMLRNREMGDYADALIAIWDGESRGTAHMIEYMQDNDKWALVRIIHD